MAKKIALEEHFLCPGFIDYWNPTAADLPPAKREQALARLTDFGETRLLAMDRAGIARAVLALAGPGVQAERDTAAAIRNARAANDFLAREMEKRPDRYSGFAHLPMQDAVAAADELERSMRELKCCGAMINGHTNGQYLDHPSLHPFWERAEALGALIYLHPADPVAPLPVLEGHRGLRRATWEWTFETGSHALRLILAACSTGSRAPGSDWGTWERHCRSCSGVSTAAPARISMRSSSPSLHHNISSRTSW